MIDIIKSAFKNLGRKRIRTVLTILGISIGVASVIIIGNISACGTTAITGELDSLGLSGLSISVSQNAKNVSMTDADLNVVKKTEQVEQAMPVMMQSTNIQVRTIEKKALVWGIDSKANQIISLKVLYGRSINNRDVKINADVCLVDENFSKTAYGRSNIVGKTISILCAGVLQNFEVVGVVKTGSGLLQNLIGDYIPTFVYIPYTTMQNAVGRNTIDQIAVKVKSGSNMETVGKSIVTNLNRNVGVSEGFSSNNLAKQKDGLTNMLDIITLILSAVGAISLLVASLSIMIVMLVSVNERTREIGIKKSIGAKRSAILFEFLFEAIMITILGCIVGIIFGYLISFAGASYFGMTLNIRFDIMLLAVGFSLLTGIIFGVYPAAKASNLKPVDALRLE
ncbi:MAG TPA: ABC transporter permease [Oscillospiraceae bacterium]|nr:ABC transporter permease [Oscillospiraceae bacterium]